MAVLTPMTLPSMSNVGPPESPRLTAASLDEVVIGAGADVGPAPMSRRPFPAHAEKV
jgi:hypothetical protein